MILSVIVPIFNSENYLRAMLDSIALQDMKNCELILIDDGSTDSSGTICDSFAEKYSYIKVFHIENKGVSNARNLGVSVSSGEYVMFLDSDDFIFENAIDIYKNSIIRNRCDLIISKSKRINTLKNTEIDIGPAENGIYKNRNDISKFLDRLDNESDRWVLDYVWNKAYKKEIILKNKLQFSVDCSLGEDFLFNCKYLSYINSLELITHLSYCYTIRGGDSHEHFIVT